MNVFTFIQSLCIAPNKNIGTTNKKQSPQLRKVTLILSYLLLFSRIVQAIALDSSFVDKLIMNNPNWVVKAHKGLLEMGFEIHDQEKKDILILLSKTSSAYSISINTMLSELCTQNINCHITIRQILKSNSQNEFLQSITHKKPDLIFSMGSAATEFLHTKYNGEGKIPVVSVCSKDPHLMGLLKEDSMPTYNIAYTSLDVPVTLQMKYMKSIVEELKFIVILYAKSNSSAIKTQVNPLITICDSLHIKYSEVIVTKTESDDIKKELTHKTDSLAILINSDITYKDRSLFWITGCTKVFENIDVINQSARTIPVLSAMPSVVKEGENSAALSIGVSFENNALKAVDYGVKILKGINKPSDFEVGKVTPPDIAINFMRIKHCGDWLKIPFNLFENATFVYDYNGICRRRNGKTVLLREKTVSVQKTTVISN